MAGNGPILQSHGLSPILLFWVEQGSTILFFYHFEQRMCLNPILVDQDLQALAPWVSNFISSYFIEDFADENQSISVLK